MKGIRRLGTRFVDAYDWEDDKDIREAMQLQTALSYHEEDKGKGGSNKSEKKKKDFDGNCKMD